KGNGMLPSKQNQPNVQFGNNEIDPTILAIEKARESEQGIITYHFEVEDTFDDYSQYDMKNLPKDKFGKEINLKPIKTSTGTKRTWSVSKPLNKQLFLTENGKPASAQDIKLVLIQTAHDMGAKYFTI